MVWARLDELGFVPLHSGHNRYVLHFCCWPARIRPVEASEERGATEEEEKKKKKKKREEEEDSTGAHRLTSRSFLRGWRAANNADNLL